MALWEHTDEDGDQIELIRTDTVQYRFYVSGTEGAQAVDLPEEELFRLRDVIEEISTS